MQKVLLVSIVENPKYSNSGVEFIKKYLVDSLDVVVDIKYFHNNETYNEMINDISLNYDYYGFSIYSTNFYRMCKIANYIKINNKKSINFFGGKFITMNYQDILKGELPIDYCIIGDGEKPIERLLLHHKKTLEKLIGDENIASATDYENKKKYINYDVNRWPCFDYYENNVYGMNKSKVHCLLTKSNVCTGACTFCCSLKGKIVYKKIDRIVNEIEYVATQYGVRDFYFSDDNIFDLDCKETKERLFELFNKIKQLHLNLVFSAFAKANSIRRENIELYKLMADIGFYYIFIGVDAGNEADRKLYNKKATLEDNINAIKILNEVDIWPRYGLISFNPYSTLETLKENYHYLLKLKSSNFYHYGGLRLQLLKTTKLYEIVKKDNLLSDEYSYMNEYGYKYIDSKVEEIVKFMREDFIPKVDNVKLQFTQLKRHYEMVRKINKDAQKFKTDMIKFEEEEFLHIQSFFRYLYEDNDLKYCKQNVDKYIKEMESKVPEFMKIYNELDNIYLTTPIKK